MIKFNLIDNFSYVQEVNVATHLEAFNVFVHQVLNTMLNLKFAKILTNARTWKIQSHASTAIASIIKDLSNVIVSLDLY